MDKLFDVIFLDEVYEFLNSLERKHYEKILYNIRKTQVEQDHELFKKLSDTFGNLGLFSKAFNTVYSHFGTGNTLVISTHGFIKKRSKVPESEIQKAKQLRTRYFEYKETLKKKKK